MDNVNLFQDAISIVIQVAGPMLLLSMLVGVFLALFQAVTQIHEQTLSFLFKLVVVIVYLTVMGGWMLESLKEFTLSVFAMM